MGNFSKPQNLSFNESNKTSSSSEKVLISHDNDAAMEPQEAVKKKQSTENRINKSKRVKESKRDNSKISQDNGIAIVNLENSTTTENFELQNISNIRNNMEKNKINKDNIVVLGDSTMKHVDGWKLSRLPKSKKKRVKVMHFSGATTARMESYIKPTLQRNTDKVILHIGTDDLKSKKELLEIAGNIIDLAKTCRENGCDTIISEILPRGDKLNKKSQEVNTALHE